MIDADAILRAQAERLIELALAEDVGDGDITTISTVPCELLGEAAIVAKAEGVIAGQFVAEMTFAHVDVQVRYRGLVADGSPVTKGTTVALIEGPVASILVGERTALNFLGRLSGIATLTARFVQQVAGSKARILDTRKTTPGLRALEKYAVRCGGGHNHRFGLFDMFLVKENHIRACGSLSEGVRRCRQTRKDQSIKIEVEATTPDEVVEAVAAGVDRIMLDNMSLEMIAECVQLVGGRVELEVSGNVSLDNVAAIARTGVDYISVGALTHSAPVLDLSLQLRNLDSAQEGHFGISGEN
ncbi:MAG: carboxylating nicotinate-nucleotide diphosphorylase [bacterium]|jgi:nicotinate-nucleotide pyrophosphorylase (carboxylating)|nr:carboxylating nicotinate-nucleotide diphosphorylase [candidate division KSB1 bacterium]MDH7558703.1 carboxylating nicotinate-nucleotide diphosphorylase [bacterium]